MNDNKIIQRIKKNAGKPKYYHEMVKDTMQNM